MLSMPKLLLMIALVAVGIDALRFDLFGRPPDVGFYRRRPIIYPAGYYHHMNKIFENTGSISKRNDGGPMRSLIDYDLILNK
jgi:hypothetical protein